jgi:hypothetical protein
MLQQKSEVEGQVEGEINENNEAKKMARKYLKEKEEDEIMAQETQVSIKNLYKKILGVQIVVDTNMEE